MRFHQPIRPGDELSIEVIAGRAADHGVQELAIAVRRAETLVASGRAAVIADRSTE